MNDKNWDWKDFHIYKWFKWKHFIYIYENNKIDKKDILNNIKNIKDIPSFAINNILKTNGNERIKENIIYFYIKKSVYILDDYYINVF